MDGIKKAVPGARRRDTRGVSQRWLGLALVGLALAGLAGCGGSKDKKSGQALASVNGEEVTMLQLNEELQRAGITAERQAAASKQLLESLIDRQLLLNEAIKEKVDRDPKVLQSVERAKALIVAQAYLQKKVGTPTRPTRAEVDEYYNKNPQFFQQRKQFDMRQLVLQSKDLTPAVKTMIDNSKTLEEVVVALDAQKVRYARAQVTRSSTDLPVELSRKLLEMNKGQLFIVREGERSLLISIADIKDAPVPLDAAVPQIEQFLLNQRGKALADAEVARLRAAAKIEYLNKGATEAAPAAPAPAPAAADPNSSAESTARGVAGLK